VKEWWEWERRRSVYNSTLYKREIKWVNEWEWMNEWASATSWIMNHEHDEHSKPTATASCPSLLAQRGPEEAWKNKEYPNIPKNGLTVTTLEQLKRFNWCLSCIILSYNQHYLVKRSKKDMIHTHYAKPSKYTNRQTYIVQSNIRLFGNSMTIIIMQIASV
jgi:hypothetical protein